MRLPADATLIVVGAEEAMEGPRDEPCEANLASLVAAWRREGLPVVHVCPADAAYASFVACPPSDGEAVVAAGAPSAFAGTGLEGLLDDSGATTLVLCGALAAVEPTARDAAGLGYHIFIPFDACRPPADPADAAFARAGAIVVDTAATLAAAATAKARQRREAQRRVEPPSSRPALAIASGRQDELFKGVR